MTDLSVIFKGVKFQNPLVLASGILGITASSWLNVLQNGAGGVTTKSLWAHPHKGHDTPVIIANQYYMMNAVGLPDAGAAKAAEEIAKYKKEKKGPLIANIVGGTMKDFEDAARVILPTKPDIFEVNLSCPNVEGEFGKPFACVAADAATVTKRVRKIIGKTPMVVKLSPNVEDIVSIARACDGAGADGFTIMNTLGPGLAIDINTRKPILTNKFGGISGPSLKPLAIKFIYDIKKALPKTHIMGCGGVMTGEDAIEMMMAGATLVQIGTAVYYRGQDAFGKIAREMDVWCRAHKIAKLSSIIGKADV